MPSYDSAQNLLVVLADPNGLVGTVGPLAADDLNAGRSLLVSAQLLAFDGAAFDRLRAVNGQLLVTLRNSSGAEVGATTADSDGYSAFNVGLITRSYLYGYNSGWDRLRAVPGNSDAVPGPPAGLLAVAAFPLVFDGTTHRRLRADPTTGALRVVLTATDQSNGLQRSNYRWASAPTAAQAVKSGAGQLYALQWYNADTAPRFLQLFDASSPTAVTPGTTEPWLTLQVAGATNLEVLLPHPLPFASGLCLFPATAEKGASGAAGGVINLFYR